MAERVPQEAEREISPREWLDSLEEPDNALTITIKRSHFYAVMVIFAFVVGLISGYMIRERNLLFPAPAAEAETASSEIAAGASSEESLPAPTEESTASRIEDLERWDIQINETDPVLGPEVAPVTIIEFADFECPFCKSYFEQVHNRLLAEYPNQIRFVFKDFPLSSIHPNANEAALAGQCAFEQDAFWPFHDLLFSGELGLNRASYEQYASTLSLDMEQFTACMDEERYADVVQDDWNYAITQGIRSTPTFFINGIGVVGAQSYEVFAEIIDYELEQFELNQTGALLQE